MVDFLQETSLHGCKYISNTSRSRPRRIIWGLFFTVAVGCCIYYCIELALRIIEFKVQTVYRLEHKDSLEFPTVVICNPCPVNISRSNEKEEVQKSGILWTSSTWSLLRETSNFTYSLEDITRLKAEMSLDMKSTILQARWGETYLNISESFKHSDVFDKTCLWFNGKGYQSKHGAFVGEHSGYDAGLEVIADVHQDLCTTGFVLEAGLEIYIQPVEDDEPSRSPVATISPGTSTIIGLSKSTKKFLEYPYTAIGDTYCTDEANYSKSNCNDGCIQKKMREKCPCVPAITKDELVGLKNCTTDEIMRDVDCFTDHYPILKSQAEKGDICYCQEKCTVSSYSIDLSFGYFPTTGVSQRLVDIGYIPNTQYARDNLLKFRINFKTLVEEIIEYVPEYTEETMIGTIGGHLGLFVGASILTLLEIVELFIFSIWSRIFNIFNRPPTGNTLS